MLGIFKKKKYKCAQCKGEIGGENMIEKFGLKFCSSTCGGDYEKENGIDTTLPSCCQK